jgi:hypothetical protein
VARRGGGGKSETKDTDYRVIDPDASNKLPRMPPPQLRQPAAAAPAHQRVDDRHDTARRARRGRALGSARARGGEVKGERLVALQEGVVAEHRGGQRLGHAPVRGIEGESAGCAEVVPPLGRCDAAGGPPDRHLRNLRGGHSARGGVGQQQRGCRRWPVCTLRPACTSRGQHGRRRTGFAVSAT